LAYAPEARVTNAPCAPSTLHDIYLVTTG